jgi:uncharacterized protein YkwD
LVVVAAFAAALLLTSAPTAPAAGVSECPNADVLYSPALHNEMQMQDGVLCLMNNERAARGLPAFTAVSALTLAGQRHSEDQAARGYISHTAPPPAPYGEWWYERIAAAGYPGTLAAPGEMWGSSEVIAWGRLQSDPFDATPRGVVTGWMTSRGHCQTLLSPDLQHAGGGVAPDTLPPLTPGQPDDIWFIWTFTFGIVGHPWNIAEDGCPASQLVTPAPPPPPLPPPPVTQPPPPNRLPPVLFSPGSPGEMPTDQHSTGQHAEGPGLALLTRTARTRKRSRVVMLSLSCEHAVAPCYGTVTLRARNRARTILGARGTRIRAGASQNVRIVIRARARRLLAARRTPVTLVLDEGGVRRTRSLTLRVSPR